MRHRKKQVKLGRTQSHRDAMLRNLATSIVLYEKVSTTHSKAKAVAPIVEKLINTAKSLDKGSSAMNTIRKLNQTVFDENAAKKLIQDLKDRYKERSAGYTRITKTGIRKGDAAPMVQIELT